MDLCTRSRIRPESFVAAVHIIFDNRIRRIQNVLGRAVILLQFYDKRIRIFLLKIEDVPDVRSAETIDGLVIVADHAQIAVLCGKQPDELELCLVRILVLIHTDIVEALLIIPEDLRMRAEKLYGLHEKIVEIKCVVALQFLLIFLIRIAAHAVFPAHSVRLFKLLGRDELILRTRNGRQNCFLANVLRIDVQCLHDLFHQCLRIVRVINREAGPVSDCINMPAQDPHTHRMERRDPHAVRAKTHDFIDSFPHLAGCLVRECNCEDIPGIHIAFLDEISDAVRDDAGLAGTGSREDQNRALRMKHSRLLLFIQGIINAHLVRKHLSMRA